MIHLARKFYDRGPLVLHFSRINLLDNLGIGFGKEPLRFDAALSAVTVVVPIDLGCHFEVSMQFDERAELGDLIT